jgi:hypothetical protein
MPPVPSHVRVNLSRHELLTRQMLLQLVQLVLIVGLLCTMNPVAPRSSSF